MNIDIVDSFPYLPGAGRAAEQIDNLIRVAGVLAHDFAQLFESLFFVGFDLGGGAVTTRFATKLVVAIEVFDLICDLFRKGE